LLATESVLIESASAEERQRVDAILDVIMPISLKIKGLENDAIWAGSPTTLAFDKITVPTLIVSCEDDLFGTANTARLIANRIPGSSLKMFREGGHVWLGHNEEVSMAIENFLST
jgi:2-hydroxy-6-oxonona-2,4-dienedioate hydrolase